MNLNLRKLNGLASFMLIFCSFLSTKITAQAPQRSCGTMDAIKYRMQTDSAYRLDFEAKQNDLNSYLAAHPVIENFASGDSVVIPVVVHIVLPNPNIITDADVDYFIARLNTDYSGRNDDSATGSPFYGVRGHSLLRFALARRDVNGNATTGIERKVGNIIIGQTDPQPIKAIANGGLAPWTISKYYNLWVGTGTTLSGGGKLLGISPGIGPGTQTGTSIDGICCDYTVFSNNPCFSLSAYNMSRTPVHEIGHNMGLYHTFQPAQGSSSSSGCSNGDFSTNLSSPGMALPANLLSPSDDTPPQDASTSGCPAQGTANGCSPSVPKMYQDYMDYTDDACYSMFTAGQVARMHYVVENFRPGYLTTKGHLPPDGTPANEAALTEIVSPGGSAMVNCTSTNYGFPACGVGKNGLFAPKIKITNFGINNLNSITGNLLINGNLVTKTVTGLNILGARSYILTFANQNLINGVNTLKFYTSNPNGVLDSINTNDTLSMTTYFFSQTLDTTSLPLYEGFESTSIDPTPTKWTVINKSTRTNTWTRTTAASKTGAACATMALWGNTVTGDIDYLKSPYLNFSHIVAGDSLFISFNYAYKLKGSAATNKVDTLSLEVSTDCGGNTWTPLWKKAGDSLKTVNTYLGTAGFVAGASDWGSAKISLDAYRTTPIYLAFKCRNGNGQNIYLDDINIYSKSTLPLTLLSFKAQQNAKSITCKWETTNEINVKDFSVERSTDGVSFVRVGTIAAAGNTTATSFYQYTDETAYNQNANTLYYRLKTNDVNGKFSYSNVVLVKIGDKQILQLYPNPAKDVITLNINNSAATATNNTIQIVDYLGRVLIEQKTTVNTSNKAIEFNIKSLPKGNYIMVVKSEIESKALKFVKE